MTTDPDRLLHRLRAADSAGLSDADASLRVLPAAIRRLCSGPRMVGRAVTADASDDLVPVLAALELAGPGDVLVLAGGSGDRALLGELFATEAVRRGLAGVVIDGLCRDADRLVELSLPIYARGTTPRAAGATRPPRVQLPVQVGAVTIRPGDVLVGDQDGVVVGTEDELVAALVTATGIQEREAALRSAIEAGESLFDHLDLHRHVEALKQGRESALGFS